VLVISCIQKNDELFIIKCTEKTEGLKNYSLDFFFLRIEKNVAFISLTKKRKEYGNTLTF